MNPDNGSHSSADDNDNRITAQIISNISKKYMTRSVAASATQPRSMDTDRSYDADIESCVSSQSDAEMPEAGTAAQTPHSPRPKRKRMKKKGGVNFPNCRCAKNGPHTQACTCSNNNSTGSAKSSPQLCKLEIDDISPTIVSSPTYDLVNAAMMADQDSVFHAADRDHQASRDCVYNVADRNDQLASLHDSAFSVGDYNTSNNDSIVLRRLRSDLTDRYQTISDTALASCGRQLRKRRADSTSGSRDTSTANKSTGDSGIFVSPNAPSHKKIKTGVGVSASTPNLMQADQHIPSSVPDCFGFECHSPLSPVERLDTPMSDYSTSLATSEALTPMDVSYNVDRNDNLLYQEDDHIKLFPTYQQRKKRKKPAKFQKKPDEMLDELNAEFSEIENFQLTIE